MNMILIFILASVINVILHTCNTLITVKCGKWASASVSAVVYGFYTWVVVLTANGNLDLWVKMIITAMCNFVGVWVVKYLEQKVRKDRMWKFELAIPLGNATTAHENLQDMNIPHNFVYVGSWCMFNCYCMTQKDSDKAVEVAKMLGGKYSAYESKV